MLLLTTCLIPLSVHAQITLDGTMGLSGELSGPQYEIVEDMGQRRGANLFHSFGQFSINEGEMATFTGSGDIRNIISRVTGGEPSLIDGWLRSEISGADIFFLNPSGILFGPNAMLDVSGSFYASTATHLCLENNGRFDMLDPENSILTADSPSAFGFLDDDPASIIMEPGKYLEVPKGETLSLTGGDIEIRGRWLLAESGQIHMASVAAAGEAMFDDSGTDISLFERHGNILLSGGSEIDVNGYGGGTSGNICIRGGRFEISDASWVRSLNESGDGGFIDIRLSGDMLITGSSEISTVSDADSNGGDISISSENLSVTDGGIIVTATSAKGYGGDINLDLKQMEITHGGSITTKTGGSGNGGNIFLMARESVAISGEGSLLMAEADVGSSGTAGNIDISSEELNVTDRGEIMAVASGEGRGGDIALNLSRLEITGGGSIFTETGRLKNDGDMSLMVQESAVISEKGSLSAARPEKETTGNAGDISISSNFIRISDKGNLLAQTYGDGNGGDITIDATRMEVTNLGAVSADAAGKETGSGRGDAGNIHISADMLSISDNGLINNATYGEGQGGDIALDVNTLDMSKGYITNTTNDMAANAGKGGNILITAKNSVSIAGSGTDEPGAYGKYHAIYAQTHGSGNGGNVTIFADQLTLSKDGWINAQTYGSGNGGNVNLDVDELNVCSGGTITTSTRCTGDAGDISITASESVSVSGEGVKQPRSWIYTASHSSGRGGDLTISSPVLSIGDHGSVFADTLGDDRCDGDISADGRAGDIFLNTENLELRDGGVVSASTNTAGKGGDISITAKEVVSISGTGEAHDGLEDSGIYARALSDGEGGTIRISGSPVNISDQGQINTSASGAGKGGDIELGTAELEIGRLNISGNAAVTAQSMGAGDAGDIHIRTTHTVQMEKSAVTTAAENSDGGNISVIAGQMLDMEDSQITATVGGGQGDGGNISIFPQSAVLDDSRIIANAYGGDGGNIRIISDGFVQSSTSIVSASSELGIDGSVEIDSADITSGLTVLPADFLNAARWMRIPCSARTGEDASHLTAGRRDGIPTQPDDWLASPPLAFRDISEADAPKPLLIRGWQSYQNGEFAYAAHFWEQAVGLLNVGAEAYVPARACLSIAYQAIGRHQDALASLRRMLPATEKSGNPGYNALFLSALGDLSLSLGKAAEAEEYLTKGAEQARRADDPAILAGVLNNLGNAYAADGDHQKAVATYEECLRIIGKWEQMNDLESAVLTNLAHAKLLSEVDEAEIVNALNLTFQHISDTPDSFHKASDLISLGLIARKAESDACHALAYQALETAGQIGEKLNNASLMSLACGYLGQLCEADARYPDALALTRKAVFWAQQKNAPEILYQWQWQLGRLFNVLGETDKSVRAYQDALATLNPIRTEFFSGWRDRRGIFHEKVRPVYLELADLLLDQASAIQDEELRKTKLRQVADTMDILKTAEFQDYFEDECVTAKNAKLTESGRIPRHAAVIYPIVFPERLELLAIFSDDIRQITVPLESGRLVKSAKRFRQRLEKASDTKRILYYARPLYDWLIRPLGEMLDARDTDTLIVAPDGVLRLIPFSALHDGERFLIEKYAVATIPAITLTDTGSADMGDSGILLNGLSEGVQGFDPLPGVEKEFDEISRLVTHSETLLNQDYTAANLFARLRGQDYPTILMATHGVFGGTPEETFLLTYDGKLTMDELEELIGLGRFRKKQAELLMLSACQTALGDERAALGLAGVALKAGARSALATLWSVYDESAAMAVTEFCRQLGSPGISKAEALRNAQRHLIAQPEYEHPVHWAPFLLIGNWS